MKYSGIMLAASLVFSTPTVIAEQDAENVIELPWKTFRGLQMAHVRKRGTAWTEKDLRLFKNAIMKDGMIDPLEQSMLDKLLADSFTFTIRSRSAPERPPVTITAASRLADDARTMLLNISAEDLQHAIAPKPGESQTSFLMRRGADGRDELVKLVVSSSDARLEFSHLLADVLNKANAEAFAINDYSGSRIRSILSTYRMKIRDLPQSDRDTYRHALRDAVIIAWYARNPGIILTYGDGLFDDQENKVDEGFAVAKALGLKKADN